MSTPPSFDPWALLAEIRAGTPDFRNFRNFRSGILENANSLEWTADDWRETFDERLAVAMDGEQPEPEARRTAFAGCITRWLDMHPATSEPDRCAWCGKEDAPGGVVPFGTAPTGHAWLHPGCWEAWFARRHEQAAAALRAMGVEEMNL